MQWYEALTDDISMKDIYSHKELIGKLTSSFLTVAKLNNICLHASMTQLLSTLLVVT